MGRKRYSEYEEDFSLQSGNSEIFSISSDLESAPRDHIRKKSKKSHKHRLRDVECSGDESVYSERKRHRHKHKRHKEVSTTSSSVHRHRSEYTEESESYKHRKRRRSHHSSEMRNKHRKHSSEVESRNRHSSRRRREKYGYANQQSSRNIKREVDLEEIEQPSRWDDNEEGDEAAAWRPIKTEPISDTSSEEDNPSNERGSSRPSREERREEERDRNDNWGDVVPKIEPKEEKPKDDKDTVNFGLSGKLTEDTNTYNGIVIKYSQPPEARKPKRRWRWYIFKGEEELPFLPLHRQSAYLIGRERKIADIPTDHPSCSKQHAVFQYRLVSYERDDGSVGRTVKPYILDLESANGTYVNNRRIDPKRYVELMEKDVVKFGYSSREYVLLHEASKGSDDEAPDVGADQSPISLLRSQ